MKKIILLLAVIFCGLTAGPSIAAAAPLQLEGKIHLIGYMPAAHYIYLDKDENVTKVVSNTSDEAEPYVIDWQNKDAAMDERIQQQYQKILEQNGNHLLAGHTYKLREENFGKSFAVISWLRIRLAVY